MDSTDPTSRRSAPGSLGGLARRLEPLRALPAWLRDAADLAAVQGALAEATVEAGQDEIPIACTGASFRLKDDGWRVRYKTTFSSEGRAGSWQLVGQLSLPSPGPKSVVAGRLTDGSWRCHLPGIGLDLQVEERDESLPLLDKLLDPHRARILLERTINENRPRSSRLRIQQCESRVMRYNPGSRCTILYRIESEWEDGHSAPTRIIAKTYRGDKGAIAYHGMRELWNSPLADSPIVSIAEPLGFQSELKLLVQDALPEETTLKNMVEEAVAMDLTGQWGRVTALAERAADCLAELHGCGVVPSLETRFEDEGSETASAVRRLSSAGASGAASAASEILEHFSAWNTECTPDPDVPSHGSFRPAQVLVSDDQIALIDFDGFCRAEPAMDVALFCASLRIGGMTAAAAVNLHGKQLAGCMARLGEICERFVGRYVSLRPVSPERIAIWEGLDLLTQLLHGWTKVKQARLDGGLPLLANYLEHRMA